MTDDPTPIWASAKAAFLAVPVLGTALWGGLGGATNALVIKVTALEALRHVAIGAAIAAGLGGLGAPSLAPVFSSMSPEVQLEAIVRWGAATMIDRSNPVLAALAAAMTVTDAQLDALFGI